MSGRNPVTRISSDLANLRRTHKNALRRALGGMNVREIDIDKVYTRKLNGINIVEEIMNEYKR